MIEPGPVTPDGQVERVTLGATQQGQEQEQEHGAGPTGDCIKVVEQMAIASRLWSNWRLHQGGGETGDCFKTVERLAIASRWWRDW